MDFSEQELTVASAWNRRASSPFPRRLLGEEIAGVDLVMLDADIAGCVDTWRGNRGRLDEWRRRMLQDRVGDLELVLPHLDEDDELSYFRMLRDLALSVAPEQ